MSKSISSNKIRILIVGETRTGADELREFLLADGYKVEVLSREVDAVSRAVSWQPDIAIVDGDLCSVDIPSLCSNLRSSGMVTAILVRVKKNTDLVIPVLDAGADDCVGDNCSLVELRARIRSQIKKMISRVLVDTDAGARTERTLCGISDV